MVIIIVIINKTIVKESLVVLITALVFFVTFNINTDSDKYVLKIMGLLFLSEDLFICYGILAKS